MRGYVLAAAVLGGIVGDGAVAAESVYQIPEVTVVGVTPVLGTGIEKDRVPANVRSVSPEDTRSALPLSAADMLDSRLGSIAVTDAQNNPLQPSVNFRGFTASPLLGEPQGLAVYQNGVRLNEAFGDVVQWDLSPSFAVHRLQVIPGSNPVFGLNALGGAISMEMKNGFNSKGGSVEAAGGMFGRARTTAEYARQVGRLGLYGGLSATTDDGWRDASRSRLVQSYTDIAIRGDRFEGGVAVTLAASDLTGNGPAPIELLSQDRSAIFTSPDQTQNSLAAITLRGSYDLSDATSLQGNAYFRRLRHGTHNGDVSELGPCQADATVLCEDPGPDEEQVVDRSGNPVSASAGGSGVMNNTATETDGLGGSLQVTHDGPLAGRQNTLVAGASIDLGRTDYRTDTEVGVLTSARSVAGSGIYLGGDEFNTGLMADNEYYGLYVTDTFSLTNALHLTAAGRYNYARIEMRDQMGAALNGDHVFQRFNPSLGLAWQAAAHFTTYASYSEANRVPTPAELSCADPARPCRVPNAFLSDPPLNQVVSRTVEVGARGAVPLAGKDVINWSLAGFMTTNQDDIIFVSAGPTIGTGYFKNAGDTLRRGIEADVSGRHGAVHWFASYGLVLATFETALTVRSDHNPGADGNGDIHVRPGDRIPGIPMHAAKIGAGYDLTDRWSVGTDAQLASGRYLRGDEANLQKKIGGYAVFNAQTSFRPTETMELFLRANNIFNTKYETAGVFGDPDEVFPSFSDNRFLSPGQPANFWAGMRVTF